jgi:hypothetical protein
VLAKFDFTIDDARDHMEWREVGGGLHPHGFEMLRAVQPRSSLRSTFRCTSEMAPPSRISPQAIR